ncbi:MAG: hypothetical protein KGZ58_13090 [Ignavibacteriales bacterium]|nr:hypothetical protein [Ignavibacteriales bacterium]
MTAKTFFNSITNGKKDFLQEFIELLEKENISYCVIGGLAVNAYAEPLVSLDLDIVIASRVTDKILLLFPRDWKVKTEKHSINISVTDSDLQVQIQRDERYQEFMKRAERKNVLGYELFVASIEDVFQGKLWAYSDNERRQSKRQKDLADIMRLVEVDSTLKKNLPKEIQEKIISNS